MFQNAHLFKSQIILVQESAYLSTSCSVAIVASLYCVHTKSQSSSFPAAMALQRMVDFKLGGILNKRLI